MSARAQSKAAMLARIERLEQVHGLCYCNTSLQVEANTCAELLKLEAEPEQTCPTHPDKPIPSVVIARICNDPVCGCHPPARATDPSGADKAIESAPPVLDIPAPQPEPLRAPEPLPAPAVPARAALLTLERTYRERPTLQLEGGFCQCGDHRLYHGPVYDGRGALLTEGQNAGRCGARDCTCEAFQPA